MNLDLFILFLSLSGLFTMISLWLDYHAVNRARRRQRLISTVCIECHSLISGPTPKPHHDIQPGICRRCADKWRGQIITHDTGLVPDSHSHSYLS